MFHLKGFARGQMGKTRNFFVGQMPNLGNFWSRKMPKDAQNRISSKIAQPGMYTV